MEEINDEIEEIEQEIKKLKEGSKDTKKITKEEVVALLKDIEKQWSYLAKVEKKNLLQEIIKEIKIKRHSIPNNREHTIEISDIIFK
ncbi:MAG TPA: hypothetical protein VK119_08690 [Bacillota bacterium]|nr:hypothetical protein [Bacillota bacterium]